MDIVIKEKPWRHAIIDNFFTDKVFEEIDKWSINIAKKVDWSLMEIGQPHGNRFKGSTNGMPIEIFNTVNKIYQEQYNNLNTSDQVMREITEADIIVDFQSRPANEHVLMGKINTSANLHTDTDFKHMSFVINLSEKGSGTSLYNSDKSFHSETVWKKNSALVFVRNIEESKATYHSIMNTVDELRRVLVVFIINKDKKSSLI